MITRTTDIEASKLSETPFATGNQKLLGHLSMMLFATVIAGSFSLGSIAAPKLEPAALNSIRFLIGTAVIGIACFVTYRGKIPLPSAPWRFFALGAPMALYFVTMFMALKIASPVSTGAVFTLGPLMSAGFGYLLLRQVSKPVVLISLLIAGLGSIWVIFNGDMEAISQFRIGRGEIIFFFGCIGHAIYTPLVKRLNRGEPVLQFTFWTLAATTTCITLYGIGDILAADWTALPSIVWITIGYLAIFATGLTFFLVQFAAMRLPASRVLAYVYLTPVVIILLEGLAGHGWASISVLAGALVIVFGLVVLVLSPDQ